MTTEELIEILKQHPGKRVVVDGYESGLEDIFTENVKEVEIKLNCNSCDLFGTHDLAKPGKSDEIALWIQR